MDQATTAGRLARLVTAGRRHPVLWSTVCFVGGVLGVLVLAKVLGVASLSAPDTLLLLLIAALLGAGAGLPRLAREAGERQRRRARR